MSRNYLADIIGNKLGFKSFLADPDLWYKPMITSEGIEYNAYILVYVDYILIIVKKPNQFMDLLKDTNTAKPSSIGEPREFILGQISAKFIIMIILMLGQWDHNHISKRLYRM